jgi:acarbose 7IV-phosphotransferase
MAKILVAGLINIETTLLIAQFPIHYSPVNYPFYGINSSVSGVGFNITKALTVLGDSVSFLSMIGEDMASKLVHMALEEIGLVERYILRSMQNTAQSVILYDSTGRRQIHTDLKNIQELDYLKDGSEIFPEALSGSELAVLCNINFTRGLLEKAKTAGVKIATDVHAVADLDDSYNCDYMQYADILFMSDELLPVSAEEWAKQVMERYMPEILVIGLGSKGALLSVREDGFMERIPAVAVRPIVNTIGAGDALFSAFIHNYVESGNPYEAIQKAILFAAYKIGAVSAADGFLNSQELDRIWRDKGGNVKLTAQSI